jgi:K+-transporting ATPase ATPase B chain
LKEDVQTEEVPGTLLRGDIVIMVAGSMIPGGGEIIEGVASVDESTITGESAPVIREAVATAPLSRAAQRFSQAG